MTFAARLVAGTALVVLAAILAHVIGVDYTLRRDLENDLRRALEREARLAARALPADSLAWQPVVQELARQTGHRITVMDRTGRVRAESDEPPEAVPRIESHAGRPEVREALEGRVGSDRRVSATVGRRLLYVAVPGGPGVVRVAASLDDADLVIRKAQRSILGAAAAALAIGVLLAWIAGRSVARPLTLIAQAARSIAQGAPPRFPRSGIPDVDGLVRALRDMHDQLEQRFEELRRERAESAALVEAMVEGVIAADGRGRIVTANAAARRLLGYQPDEPLPALDQLFRAKAARDAVDRVLAGQALAGQELELDGHIVLLSARPLPAGGALLVLHDVTELRRLETVRRDFVANVSHELKTPLTSISGYAETLVHDAADPETARKFLQVILANARRMQRLVDGLLDLSRIESGGWRPAPERLETAAVAREVLGLYGDRAASRDVALQLEVEPGAEAMHADPDALRQVLSNLLDNALRYTPSGGRITVRAGRWDGGVALSVQDTGSGITGDHLPRIFERFYRADPGRSREEGGTGLGLAIVKHLVEAHRGEVQAESQVGTGTTITCWFPDPEARPQG
ncbi:MAG TPA: ATP-binding protein [Gemmatimonadales bacterium]|jgi:signal transduction histidine kinase|nr:ATP-binding protein [Gemmatimonadales bacterium]